MDDSSEHEHCRRCVRVGCDKDRRVTLPPTNCPVIRCGLMCGAAYHKCKDSEHQELCPLQRVHCINRCNGCPATMLRKKLAAHLSGCPASVVYCTMEWNRWPVYSMERQLRVPFTQTNLHARYGQLDVALALRDQGVLSDGMKAPQSVRRALRNRLTERFPAVPLPFQRCSYVEPSWEKDEETSREIGTVDLVPDGTLQSESQTGRDEFLSDEDFEDDDTPWEIRKNPPGLRRCIIDKLCSANANANCNTMASDAVTAGSCLPMHESMTASSASFECDTSDANQISVFQAEQTCTRLTDSVANLVTRPSDVTENGPGDVTLIEPIQSDQSFKNTDDETIGTETAAIVSVDLLPHISSISNADRLVQVSSLQAAPPSTSNPPPTAGSDLPLALQHILALDLNIESITRYQSKSRSMYTFLCAQSFRRDEYCCHFRNVHTDIHSGLNGWLQVRCPLAQYGCTYSVQHLSPANGSFVFSSILDSFGFKPDQTGFDSSQGSVLKVFSDSLVPGADSCLDRQNDNSLYNKTEGQPRRCVREITPEVFTSCNYDTPIAWSQNLSPSSTSGEADSAYAPNQPVSASTQPFPESFIRQKDSGLNHNAGMRMQSQVENGYMVGRENKQEQEEVGFDRLSNLPAEILRRIALHLDGFSLSNLAVTSYGLREVCKDVVEDRGMVIQEWERKVVDGCCQWRVSYQRWTFSTSFSYVKDWKLSSSSLVSSHLSQCPFFVRSELPQAPVALPYIASNNSEIVERLSTMYGRAGVCDAVAGVGECREGPVHLSRVEDRGLMPYQTRLKQFMQDQGARSGLMLDVADSSSDDDYHIDLLFD